MSKVQRITIGKIKCLLCGNVTTLRASFAEPPKAYYTCEVCVSQHFARGLAADSKLRALVIAAEPAPAPAPKPSPTKEPASAKKPEAKPAAAPAVAQRRGIWND